MPETNIKIIVPKTVREQIDYVCRRFPDKEWSGVVFYSTTGTIENPETFKITLKDLFPMNIGTPAYTESDFNEKLVQYQIENNLLKFFYAVIHSHNTMDAYFSAIDMSELRENAHCHNIYCSIVVNNFGKIVGRIAQQLYLKPNALYYRNQTGKNIDINGKISSENLVMFKDCDIVIPETTTSSIFGVAKICETLKLSTALQNRQYKYRGSKNSPELAFNDNSSLLPFNMKGVCDEY